MQLLAENGPGFLPTPPPFSVFCWCPEGGREQVSRRERPTKPPPPQLEKAPPQVLPLILCFFPLAHACRQGEVVCALFLGLGKTSQDAMAGPLEPDTQLGEELAVMEQIYWHNHHYISLEGSKVT